MKLLRYWYDTEAMQQKIAECSCRTTYRCDTCRALQDRICHIRWVDKHHSSLTWTFGHLTLGYGDRVRLLPPSFYMGDFEPINGDPTRETFYIRTYTQTLWVRPLQLKLLSRWREESAFDWTIGDRRDIPSRVILKHRNIRWLDQMIEADVHLSTPQDLHGEIIHPRDTQWPIAVDYLPGIGWHGVEHGRTGD